MAGALSTDSALSSPQLAPPGGVPARTCLPSPGHPVGWTRLRLDKSLASDSPGRGSGGSRGRTTPLSSQVGKQAWRGIVSGPRSLTDRDKLKGEH